MMQLLIEQGSFYPSLILYITRGGFKLVTFPLLKLNVKSLDVEKRSKELQLKTAAIKNSSRSIKQKMLIVLETKGCHVLLVVLNMFLFFIQHSAFNWLNLPVVMVNSHWLCSQGWSKGVVFINGKNLGRYWSIGPQQTLYVPGPWLHKGDNEVQYCTSVLFICAYHSIIRETFK